MFMIATVHMVMEGSSTSTIYVLRPAERSTYYIYHSSRYTLLYIVAISGIREERGGGKCRQFIYYEISKKIYDLIII